MEVLLNTIWLLVSIAAFVCWRPDRFNSTQRGQTRLLAVVTLACALLLLFPVISLTDDLHAEQYPMEDSSRSVIKARHLAHGCLRASRSPLVMASNFTAHSAASLNLIIGAVVPPEIHPFHLALAASHQGRSPPSAL